MSKEKEIVNNDGDLILRHQIAQKRLKGWSFNRICKEFNINSQYLEKQLLLWLREALGAEENTKRLITELALVRFDELINRIWEVLSDNNLKATSNEFKSLAKLLMDIQGKQLMAAGIIKNENSKDNNEDLAELQEEAKRMGIAV